MQKPTGWVSYITAISFLISNERKELLATARIILYFMESKTMKRTAMPGPILKKLKPYFH